MLPAVCGRICTHPCEAACRRGEKDEALAIRDIKRFVADQAAALKTPRLANDPPARAERIAVIGSGPAGLAAAADLARQGFGVTIFEKESEVGGLLRYGIGPHRLPRDILDAEITAIQAEGVKIVTNHAVALPQGLAELRKNHQAVIVTTGSWADRRLGVEGETLAGVEGCVAFLNRFYRGEAHEQSGQVAVIGDGNAALDLARVLRRLGAAVTIISWFAQSEIPADADEVEAALAEGITILDRRQVVGFQGANGVLQGLLVRATQPGAGGCQGYLLARDSARQSQGGDPFRARFCGHRPGRRIWRDARPRQSGYHGPGAAGRGWAWPHNPAKASTRPAMRSAAPPQWSRPWRTDARSPGR